MRINTAIPQMQQQQQQPAAADLRLASAYVPAIVCTAKAMFVAAMATLLIPSGGGPVMALGLVMDRLMVVVAAHKGGGVFADNGILDVNAVVCFVFGLLCTTTQHQTMTVRHPEQPLTLLLVLWAGLGLAQITRPTLTLRFETLLLYAAATGVSVLPVVVVVSAPSLSSTPTNPQSTTTEPLPFVLGRVFGFVLATSCAVYTTAANGGGAMGWGAPARNSFLFVTLLRSTPILLMPQPALGLGLAFVTVCAILGRWYQQQEQKFTTATSSARGGANNNSNSGGGDGFCCEDGKGDASVSIAPTPSSILMLNNNGSGLGINTAYSSSSSASSVGGGGDAENNNNNNNGEDDLLLWDALAKHKGVAHTQ
jgi:hypothetical protein